MHLRLDKKFNFIFYCLLILILTSTNNYNFDNRYRFKIEIVEVQGFSSKKNKTIVPRIEFKLSSSILRPNERYILNFAISGHPHLAQKGRGALAISALAQTVIQDPSL